MTENDLSKRVQAVRGFNRFYTKLIGVLNTGFLSSPFSLTEVRVIYELAHRGTTTATELCSDLDMDPGQLSRMLQRLQQRDLIAKQPSVVDGRQSHLTLTEAGHDAFDVLNEQQTHEVEALLRELSPAEQHRLVEAMSVIQELFSPSPELRVPYTLRPHRSGDMGWVVMRHGELYAQEYRWDEQFEGLVAGIVADFIKNYDSKRERCWIAERDGENVGSIFLVKHSDSVAKLRLFLVDPKARGLGIGKRLVDECLHFARHAGYSKVTLWTNDVLVAARHIYQQVGFRLVHEEPQRNFGHDLISQTWEIEL